MLRFILRRLLQMVGVVFVLSLLLFLWLRSLPGGTVSAILGERATPARRAALDQGARPRPAHLRAVLAVPQARRRGASSASPPACLPGGTPCTSSSQRLPATIELSVFALLFAIALGIPLGYMAARRADAWFDNLSVVGSLIGVAVPGLLPGLPAQVLVRHPDCTGCPCPVARTPASTRPGSPASSSSTAS